MMSATVLISYMMRRRKFYDEVKKGNSAYAWRGHGYRRVSACGQKDDGKRLKAERQQKARRPALLRKIQGMQRILESRKNWTLPLTEEKKELTVWMVYNGTEVSDLNEIKSVQKMEELTNVHINWIAVGQQELTEKFGLVLGSGDYPDIMAYYSYPGGTEKALKMESLLIWMNILGDICPIYESSLSK